MTGSKKPKKLFVLIGKKRWGASITADDDGDLLIRVYGLGSVILPDGSLQKSNFVKDLMLEVESE
jgi:hypothetical protein